MLFQAGVFPDTAILTMHNCELEVLPQSAYKLPRGTERVLLMDRVMVAATNNHGCGSVDASSGSNGGRVTRQPKERRKGAVHVVSAHHAELHLVRRKEKQGFDSG